MRFSRFDNMACSLLSRYWWCTIGMLLTALPSSECWYSNVTLTSNGGDLSVVVYLPKGIKDEQTFYYATRFDHGSMIGSVRRKVRTIGSDGVERTHTHVLYGTDMWRIPHNSNWPESGVGLASEFGVGDDGAFCFYRCGWSDATDVTNGLLGYREARLGGSFLKIGVGELIKGTCPICDSTEDYRFNSPYLFAKQPSWTLSQPSANSVRLEHEATLNEWGYNLVKDISLNGSVLSVTTTLTNLGNAFETVWYSHNFFTCDGNAVGPGYSVDLDLKGDNRERLYLEPGTWSWSDPLADFAHVTTHPSSVHVDMVRALDPGVKIKTEFINDGETKGSFRLNACETSITSTIPELDGDNGFTMYAYNLYIERGTFSPEPQILLNLDKGQSESWTQHLVFDDIEPTSSDGQTPVTFGAIFPLHRLGSTNSMKSLFGIICMLGLTFTSVLVAQSAWSLIRRHSYTTLPDSL